MIPEGLKHSIMVEMVDYKVYKIKPYLNSDKEPFGLTINGKAKEYIHAHQTIKELLKKGKQFIGEDGVMKILDVTNNAGKTNSIVEVSVKDGGKGNVEMKVYNPSVHKKKGATIEMRKMSGFEYCYVDLLPRMITTFLDGFISGDSIDDVIKNARKVSVHKPRVTSKTKLFNCDLCNFQTRFATALKGHKTRIHVEKRPISFQCDQCTFKCTSENVLNEHKKIRHKPSNKRAKT